MENLLHLPWWQYLAAYVLVGHLWGIAVRLNKPYLRPSTLGLIVLTWPIGVVGTVLLFLVNAVLFVWFAVTSLIGWSIVKLVPHKEQQPKW